MPVVNANHGFKVGDEVLCVIPGAHLILGARYIISHETGKNDEPGWVRIQGQYRGFYPDRFKLVVKEPEVVKKAVEKEPVAVAKAGDVVIPRKFDADVKRADGLVNPGWNPDMERMVGKPIEAMAVGHPFERFVPMLHIGQYFWPIEALDVVKDGKVIKAAKAAIKKIKVKKPRKVALRVKLNAEARVMTCSYGHEYANGTYNMQSSDACHARLRAGTKDNPLVALALHFAKYVKTLDKDDQKTFNKYYNYLANRSPGANAFKTKKASEALSRGILMNVQETAAKIGWAAVALRQATEHGGVLRAYAWALSNKGISEHAAFLFANTHRLNNNQWSQTTSGSHQCLHGELNFHKMVKAFKHGFYDVNKGVPMAVGGGYSVSPNWYEGATAGYGREAKPEDKLLTVLEKAGAAVERGAGWEKKVIITDEVAIKRLKFINDAINAVK